MVLLSFICYQPSAWSWLILEYRRVARPFQKFPTLYWTRWFITAVTTVGYLSVSRSRWINDTFVLPDSLRACVILSSHLWLGLQSSLFPSGFSTKSIMRNSILSVYPPRVDHLNTNSNSIVEKRHIQYKKIEICVIYIYNY